MTAGRKSVRKGGTIPAEESAESVPVSWQLRPAVRFGAVVCLLALLVILRLVALDSDAYEHLDWSTGLLTDEGFYIHNARNVALFGHPVTDDFNNALIMPLLHLVQVAVFSVFGVGVVQARLISVVSSLLALGVLFLAFRRAFGGWVAACSVVLLGLDHVSLLFNRLALMDTPATLAMACAFGAFVYVAEKAGKREAGSRKSPARDVSALFPAFLCGVLLAVVYVMRGLAAFLIPVPFLLLWRAGQRQALKALAAGLGLGLLVYVLCWYLPHRAELMHANRYYLTEQLLPHSLNHLRIIVTRAVFGENWGVAPYLFHHTPVQFGLALAWLFSGLDRNLTARQRLCAQFLALWLVFAWLLFSVAGYTATRYYVLFYPALAGIAALTLSRLDRLGEALQTRPWLRCGLGGFLAYHLWLTLLPHERFLDILLFGGVMGLTVLLLYFAPRWMERGKREAGRGESSPQHPTPYTLHPGGKRAAVALLAVWAVVNLYWMGDWLLHLSYHQRDADRWLAAHLPANSVLLGAIAPGLCMNNRFVVVNVMRGLCNDTRPVERFAPAPRYILILDVPWEEKWWVQHYPELVAPERRLHLFKPILRRGFSVGVYAAPQGGRYAGHRVDEESHRQDDPGRDTGRGGRPDGPLSGERPAGRG